MDVGVDSVRLGQNLTNSGSGACSCLGAAPDESAPPHAVATQRTIAHREPAAHQRVHDLDLPAIINGKPSVRPSVGALCNPGRVKINAREIRVVTDDNRPLPGASHDARRVSRKVRERWHRAPYRACDTPADQHGQQSLEAGETRRCIPDATHLGPHIPVQVISSHNVNLACEESSPQSLRAGPIRPSPSGRMP
jgi:hypothetical protein